MGKEVILLKGYGLREKWRGGGICCVFRIGEVE